MKKNILNSLPIPLIFLATIFFKGLLVLYVPGLLLIFLARFCKQGILMKIAMVVFSSLAFWIIGFWFLKFIPIGLSDFVYGIIGVFALSFVFLLRFKGGGSLRLKDEDILVVLVILGLGFLRLVPFFTTIAPSGADVTMHTYMTQFILYANGIPGTLDPILPGAVFGSYSAGFHVVSAIVSFLTGWEAYRAVFFVGSLSALLFTLALSCFLFNKIKNLWLSIFVASFISFLTINPQLFAVWGGYPSGFAFAFAVMAFALVDKLFATGKERGLEMGILMLLIAACFFSHLVIFGTFAILFFVVVLTKWVSMLFSAGFSKSKKVFLRWVLVLFGFGLLLVPYFWDGGLMVSEAGRSFTIDWVRNTWVQARLVLSGSEGVLNMLGDDFFSHFLDLFLMLIYSLGVAIFILTILSSFFVKRFARDVWRKNVNFFFLVFLLMIISRFELIKNFYVFYPERLAMFAILPLSAMIEYALTSFVKETSRKALAVVLVVFVLLLGLNFSLINMDDYRSHYFLAINHEISVPSFLFREMFLGNYYIYILGREQNVVTDADLKAFNWISENTKSDDLFWNSYNDAGLWIAAIPFRPIVNVHTNPFMVEEAQAMWARTDYDYVYVGNKKNVRIDDTPVDTSSFDNDPKLQLVFREEKASVYKVIEDGLDNEEN